MQGFCSVCSAPHHPLARVLAGVHAATARIPDGSGSGPDDGSGAFGCDARKSFICPVNQSFLALNSIGGTSTNASQYTKLDFAIYHAHTGARTELAFVYGPSLPFSSHVYMRRTCDSRGRLNLSLKTVPPTLLRVQRHKVDGGGWLVLPPPH